MRNYVDVINMRMRVYRAESNEVISPFLFHTHIKSERFQEMNSSHKVKYPKLFETRMYIF